MRPAITKKHIKSIELTPIVPLKVLTDNYDRELDETDLSISKDYDIDIVYELDNKLKMKLKSGLSHHTLLATETTLKSGANCIFQTGTNENPKAGAKLGAGRIEKGRRVRFAKTVCIPSEDLKKRKFAHIKATCIEDLKKLPITKRMDSFVITMAINNAKEQQAIIKQESNNIQAAHSRLTDFFDRKKQIEKKYKELLSAIDVEQNAEIKIKAHNLNENTEEVMENIKETYNNTRSLVQQQKIIEESDLLKEYEREIKGNM